MGDDVTLALVQVSAGPKRDLGRRPDLNGGGLVNDLAQGRVRGLARGDVGQGIALPVQGALAGSEERQQNAAARQDGIRASEADDEGVIGLGGDLTAVEGPGV